MFNFSISLFDCFLKLCDILHQTVHSILVQFSKASEFLVELIKRYVIVLSKRCIQMNLLIRSIALLELMFKFTFPSALELYDLIELSLCGLGLLFQFGESIE